MHLGPFNAPLALAARPIMAVFWAIFATQIFAILVVAVLNVFTADWASAQFRDGGDVTARWMIYTLAAFCVLVAMSLWSERIGAGPFAGSMRASSDWIALGAVTGPIILMLTTFLVGLLFSNGEPGWMYREGGDPQMFSRAAFGPIMIGAVILVAPLVEEIGFRGIAMGCLLARGWPPLAATVLTAAAFTGLHTNYVLPALIPVFIVGLYLGALRIVSGSMAAPIAAHVSANAVNVLVMAISLA
ncbi:MAG: CPBP family intramembrane glutamic endopeptidase [Pseudomonadota bacterium]